MSGRESGVCGNRYSISYVQVSGDKYDVKIKDRLNTKVHKGEFNFEDIDFILEREVFEAIGKQYNEENIDEIAEGLISMIMERRKNAAKLRNRRFSHAAYLRIREISKIFF